MTITGVGADVSVELISITSLQFIVITVKGIYIR